MRAHFRRMNEAKGEAHLYSLLLVCKTNIRLRTRKRDEPSLPSMEMDGVDITYDH